jgi:hypothetical protein
VFDKLTLVEQIAVAFVVLGSIVDVVQFSWIIKRAVSKFKSDYEKRLIRKLTKEGYSFVEKEKATDDPLSLLPGSFAQIPRTVLGTKEEDSQA